MKANMTMNRRAVLLLPLATLLTFGQKNAVNDGLITDEVRLRLSGDAMVKGAHIEADTKDGVVTLTGEVPTEKLKERATRLTKKVKGVKSVVNNLKIE
jgi:hyperosmotically inducible periplasmic protein